MHARYRRFLRHLIPCVLLTLVSAGCSTTAMKGTPFFTGESPRRTGAADDRVNLWPMLYYREPDLSVLWPLGEYTGDRLALRPFFSIENLDQPQHVYKVLWPLGHFDSARDNNRFFPFFWGTDHRVVFPLYWHYGKPLAADGTGSDSLWPLWCYFHDHHQYSLHLLWPFFNIKAYDDEQGWRLWPLYGSYENPKQEKGHRYALWPLAWHTWEKTDHTWTLFPIFHDAHDSDTHTFGTLLGGWQHDREAETTDWFALPILGWGSSSPDASRITALLGLYGRAHDNTSASSRLIPLYYSKQTPQRSLFLSPLFYYAYNADRDRFLSPLYSSWDNTDGGATRLLPPLLSAYSARTNRWDLWTLAGLGHASGGSEGGSSHLFPIYYANPSTLLTPLFGGWQDNGTRMRYWLTPLLGTRSGQTHGSWLAPLYSYSADPARKTTQGSYLIFGEFHRSTYESYTHFPLLFAHERWKNPIEEPLTPGRREGWRFDALLLAKFSSYRYLETRTPALVVVQSPAELPPAIHEPMHHGTSRLFPLWSYDAERSATGNWQRASGSLLFCLYDYRREHGLLPPQSAPHDYTRRRVLFRLYHHERLNGATSLDIFPGITYDRDPAADKRSFTLFWRLFRYARAPDKRTLDLLFIPIWRKRIEPHSAPEAASEDAH